MPNLNLYISLYPEKNPERMAELIECFKKNSLVFDRIFILLENAAQFEHHESFTNEKSVILPISVRPTFRSFFNFINTLPNYFNIDNRQDINVLCNSDIYFDKFTKFPQSHECFALCRYEIEHDGKITFLNRRDSQDSYLFVGHIRIPRYCDFWSWPGGDNRICYEIKEAGYQISNPSITIKTYHLHKGEKSYDGSNKVNRPYLFLTPTE